MNSLFFSRPSIWADFLEQLPCALIWITLIIALAAVLKTVLPLIIANCHEKKMKEKSFEHEAWWHYQRKINSDFNKAMEEQSKELSEKIKQLKEELKRKKASREDELKQERLQFEHDYYKNLLGDFYGKRDENK